MKACPKCFETKWNFERVEKVIIATCLLCGYDVQFDAKKTKVSQIAKNMGSG